MKKMTVTELNALTDYVVESVLNAKRESMKKSRSTITEQELNELYAKAKKLSDAKAAAQKALGQAENELREFAEGLSEKNFEARYVYVDTYAYGRSEAEIRTMSDEQLFDGTNLNPLKLRKDVERKLVLKNLGSEVDVEKFVQELVASY
jgi:hypothetical protein